MCVLCDPGHAFMSNLWPWNGSHILSFWIIVHCFTLCLSLFLTLLTFVLARCIFLSVSHEHTSSTEYDHIKACYCVKASAWDWADVLQTTELSRWSWRKKISLDFTTLSRLLHLTGCCPHNSILSAPRLKALKMSETPLTCVILGWWLMKRYNCNPKAWIACFMGLFSFLVLFFFILLTYCSV